MPSHRLILGFILLTLLATILVAAAKLTATPMYDQIRVGMEWKEATRQLGQRIYTSTDHATGVVQEPWQTEEGTVVLTLSGPGPDSRVIAKSIDRRGPLERLTWVAGWR